MSGSIHNSQRVRLFKSDALERTTLLSPQTFAAAWSVLAATLIWTAWGTASIVRVLVLVASGMFVWTLFEYALHRFVFHFDNGGPRIKRTLYLMHGNHHDDPSDPLRGLMPLPISVSVTAISWTTIVLAFGLEASWSVIGALCGYLLYDTLHYACHHAPMRGRLGSALKRHHMRHHYVDHRGNYAISAIGWDRVLGSRIGSVKRPSAKP
ncbi:sterol desaturase family protein [Novosphingobium sp.]|uniref:sterol desaturase family protein n=1 Tax=Novosphingobium sp. TaxID=1874826 RepID=UPI0025FC98C2|nr:sterol desaturase family protein [Novosphingobium sp.]